MRIYYRGNTQVIELPELTDHQGNAVTGATVKATITLQDGTGVPGISNPISLDDQGAGKYLGIVPSIDLKDGSIVVVEVKAEYANVEATSRESFTVRDRGFSR